MPHLVQEPFYYDPNKRASFNTLHKVMKVLEKLGLKMLSQKVYNCIITISASIDSQNSENKNNKSNIS